MTQAHKQYLQGHSQCELCGSPKSLELHHIVPRVFGGPDEVDNWIAICSICHTKLTPKRILTKRGIENVRPSQPIIDFYERLDEVEPICGSEVLDIFQEIFLNEAKPVKAFYVND